MENVVVHIISHSHWDREWHSPLKKPPDAIMELFDNLFRSFWK